MQASDLLDGSSPTIADALRDAVAFALAYQAVYVRNLGLLRGSFRLSAGCSRQLSTLERGGNVTLHTLRKVLGFLPNLEEFTFEQVRMKPIYIDLPPFEWQVFYATWTRCTRHWTG
jgi:hypothetical protein